MGAKKAVLIDGDGKTKTEFMKVGIGSGNRFDEKWLQDQIFEDISLLSVIDPSFEKIALVPLCREFALHDTVRNVFLDILAVTATGQLVLVECKLWKNPQARREVVAQIFEYASLLKSLSYGDLVAKLKKSISSGEEDPILHQFRMNGVEFDEARLIDNVSHSLKTANFQLVIAGDGIRADLVNLTKSTNFSGVIGDLSLLEISLYQSSLGATILVPSVPAKTETVVKTIMLTRDGDIALVEEDADLLDAEDAPNSVGNQTRAMNKEFWDLFLTQMKFDNPEQSAPRRNGVNAIKAVIPEPFKWVTAWRSKNNKIGVFARCASEDVDQVYEFFLDKKSQLESELGPEVRLEFNRDGSNWENAFFISIQNDSVGDIYDRDTYDSQIAWLSENLNNYVTTLRPMAREYSEAR